MHTLATEFAGRTLCGLLRVAARAPAASAAENTTIVRTEVLDKIFADLDGTHSPGCALGSSAAATWPCCATG